LEIARQSVEAVIMEKPVPNFSCNTQELQEKHGAFVTLKTHGQLRGCIGCFTSTAPLYQLVSEMAIASARDDTRFEFNRVRPEELNSVTIEISVLSPLKRIKDPLDFELGKEGIYITKDGQSGCFLPQVATDTGWSKEEFLTHCCKDKAGLPANAWKSGEAEIYTFTAEIIKESRTDE